MKKKILIIGFGSIGKRHAAILNKNILNLVKKKSYLDFNVLLSKCIKENKKVGCYQIKDKGWIDIGQMDKYKNFLNKKI